ncbi:MtnX-like HAD-IB family phosphatase [Acinetobacter stercoris]|uniref:2-hydroxy-3-keto-5-methylthiopentenyl-1-phosphate phosphatase n=1 Tax=Acinetobacter stercoris TaxID=2126983 RepID=A0A2U3MZW4_9GAMM|nr:MtnX-like HAD-IB family phosphatase [Acinetobacter stercoris]SPL70966.1 2-hydroxy-3-keto-5-methylthiopentenyl-1-phosphatephosphatase [Acinetobacter stercoris]
MFLISHDSYPSVQWHILCDFDGTISLKDTTDHLLEKFALAGWQEIEQEWEQGKIGSKACMQRQIALLDMTETELQQCLDQIEIDSGFIDLVKLSNEHNIPLTIVSDGLDIVIKYILKKYDLAHLPIIANHLVQVDERHWQLEFPNSNPNCLSQSGTCKCMIAEQHYQEQTILIGDGRSDFCLAETADYVFAKKSLIQHCLKKKITHVSFDTFAEIQKPLTKILRSQYRPDDSTMVTA